MFKERVVEMTPQKHGLLCQYFTILFKSNFVCVGVCTHMRVSVCSHTKISCLWIYFFQIVKGNV